MPLSEVRAVERCHNASDHVRLTFDDGGTPAQVGSVLDPLRRNRVSSTRPRLLRPPFGAGALSRRLARIAHDSGHRVCRWTTGTYDWDDQTPVVMTRRVRYGDYRSAPIAAGGGNDLMHGTGRYTAAGSQRIIDGIRARKLGLQPLG